MPNAIFKFLFLVGLTFGCAHPVFARDIFFIPTDPIYIDGQSDLETRLENILANTSLLREKINPDKVTFLTNNPAARTWIGLGFSILAVGEPFHCFFSVTKTHFTANEKSSLANEYTALAELRNEVGTPPDGCRVRLVGFKNYLFMHPSELWFTHPQRAIFFEQPLINHGPDNPAFVKAPDPRLVLFDLNLVQSDASKVAHAGIYEQDGSIICEGVRIIARNSAVKGRGHVISGDINFSCPTHGNIQGHFTREQATQNAEIKTTILLRDKDALFGKRVRGQIIGYSSLPPNFLETTEGKKLIASIQARHKKTNEAPGRGQSIRSVRAAPTFEKDQIKFELTWEVANISQRPLRTSPVAIAFYAKDNTLIDTVVVDKGGTDLMPNASKSFSANLATKKFPQRFTLRFVSEQEAGKLSRH